MKEARKQKAFAVLHDCPSSPQKMRLVADLVRGMDVQKALDTLKFCPKEAARKVEKLLLSAIANWSVKNDGARIDDAALCFAQLTREHLSGQKRTEEIEVENESDAGRVEIKKGLYRFIGRIKVLRHEIFLCSLSLGIVSARAVKQDIDGAEAFQRCLKRSRKAFPVQHIGGKRQSGAARLGYKARSVFGALQR